MADTLPPLVQEYRAKADQLLDEQKKVRKSTKDMTDETDANTSKMKGGFASIAGGVAIGTLAVDALKVGLGALGGAIKSSVSAASDLNEAGTAVGAVFGDSYESIRSWAEGASAALGQSTLQALDAAKTFGVYGQAAGLSAEANAEFSKTLVATASDLASFHNADPSEVIEALGSGLRGEAEPLRKFGILLDDATLKAKAMELGLYDGNGALDNQAKILASNEVIMSSLGAAAGDFGRTSGGLANQQRILSAQFTNLSASVGTIFLPILQTTLGFITSNVMPGVLTLASTLADRVGPAFEIVSSAVGGVKAILTTGDFNKAVSDAFGGVEEDSPLVDFLLTLRETFITVAGVARDIFVPAFEALAPVFAPLIGQIVELWTSFSPLSIIFQAILPVLPALVGAIVELGTAIGTTLGQTLTTILPVISELAGMLAGQLGAIIQALVPVVLQLVPVVAQLAETLGGVLGDVLTTLVPIIGQIVGILAGQLGKVLVTLAPIVGRLAAVIGGALGEVLKVIAPLLVQVASFVGQLLAAVLPLINPVLQLVMAFVPLLEPIIQLVSSLLGPLIGLIGALLTPIMGLVSGFVKFLAPAISGLVSIITTNLMPIIKGITTVLGGVVDFITGVFSGNWDRAWRGIIGIFSGIWATVRGIVSGAINGVIDLINGIIGGINNLANGIKDATGGAIDIRLGKIPRVSFDVGTDRVPGATGAPLPAIIHGGEAILSNDMLAGRVPIPSRVSDAVDRSRAATRGNDRPPNKTTNIKVYATTNASASRIAHDIGWELKKDG